jgi:hypothetical protein
MLTDYPDSSVSGIVRMTWRVDPVLPAIKPDGPPLCDDALRVFGAPGARTIEQRRADGER